LGLGAWAPTPHPQSPIPNPQSPFLKQIKINLLLLKFNQTKIK